MKTENSYDLIHDTIRVIFGKTKSYFERKKSLKIMKRIICPVIENIQR
jgi:hypothetical protein